ncbi:MAG: SPFH domain-containing protein [Clostridia bacterium]
MLFNFIKKQMLKVIEWKDDSQDTILFRFDVEDRYEIMRGSQLIVRESQVAIFVIEGKVADIFAPGRYKLDTENLPVITNILNWKYAFENPFTGDVYFINTKQFTNQKWGTSNPIMMRDADFGMIRLRGYGIYTYRVDDAAKLMREIAGTNKEFKTDNISDQLRKMIISTVSDVIAEAKLPALDLAMNYDEMGIKSKERLATRFSQYGFELIDFCIENLSLPEEVEKTMDTRTSMGLIGDKMGTYTQYQAAQAMRDAAQNTSGGLAGAGVGLGAGLGIGGMFTDAIKNAKDAPSQPQEKNDTIPCSKCGHQCLSTAKFCPECGEKIVKPTAKFCPHCGKPLTTSAKFCPECGGKL